MYYYTVYNKNNKPGSFAAIINIHPLLWSVQDDNINEVLITNWFVIPTKLAIAITNKMIAKKEIKKET